MSAAETENKKKRGRKPNTTGLSDKSVTIKKKPKRKTKGSQKMNASNSDASDTMESVVLSDPDESPKSADLRALLLSIKKSQCTKKDMKLYTETINSKLVDIESKISKHDDSIALVNKRLEKCENQAATAQFGMELEKQRSLKNNISVFGIGHKEGENLQQIILSLFQKIGCNVNEKQISSCYRLSGKGKGIIIVKLSDYELKLNILKIKAKKPVTVGELLSDSTNDASDVIYINNHVTPFFGKLLQEGRKASKNGDIHSCWLNAFGCQLKFAEDGKQHMYRSIEELTSLIKGNMKQKPANLKRSAPDDRSPTGNKTKTTKP